MIEIKNEYGEGLIVDPNNITRLGVTIEQLDPYSGLATPFKLTVHTGNGLEAILRFRHHHNVIEAHDALKKLTDEYKRLSVKLRNSLLGNIGKSNEAP